MSKIILKDHHKVEQIATNLNDDTKFNITLPKTKKED